MLRVCRCAWLRLIMRVCIADIHFPCGVLLCCVCGSVRGSPVVWVFCLFCVCFALWVSWRQNVEYTRHSRPRKSPYHPGSGYSFVSRSFRTHRRFGYGYDPLIYFTQVSGVVILFLSDLTKVSGTLFFSCRTHISFGYRGLLFQNSQKFGCGYEHLTELTDVSGTDFFSYRTHISSG